MSIGVPGVCVCVGVCAPGTRAPGACLFHRVSCLCSAPPPHPLRFLAVLVPGCQMGRCALMCLRVCAFFTPACAPRVGISVRLCLQDRVM